jgi:MraZ protein
VQHAILTGEHEIAIDEKNRLLIPAEIRKSIDPERDGEAFFLTVGVNRRPWLYPEKNYAALVNAERQDIIPDADNLAFDQMFFANAARVEMDKAGRILIPDKMLRRTATGKEVTLIGVNNHLELWNRADWESQFQENLARMSELAQRAKKARTTQHQQQ